MASLTERDKLERALLKQYEDCWKEIWETWKLVEVKAQGVLTVSGFYLAAIVAFLTKGSLDTGADRMLIFLVASSIVAVIMFGVKTLLVTETLQPPHSDGGPIYLRERLQQADNALTDEMGKMRRKMLQEWQACIEDSDLKLRMKNKYLENAQTSAILATISVLLFITKQVVGRLCIFS